MVRLRLSAAAHGQRALGRWWSTEAVYWTVRGLGFAILVGVLSGAIGSGIGSRYEIYTIVQLAIVGPLFVLLAYLDLCSWDLSSVRLRTIYLAVLVVSATTGALTVQLGLQSITIAYTVAACYEGGHRLSTTRSTMVVAAGVLGVLVSSVLFGFGLGSLLGWPLAMVVCLVLGRVRQVSQDRGDRLESLMAQMRDAQQRERRSAALEERHRIAREIHDVLAQSLSALGLQIEAARALLLDREDIAAALHLLDGAQTLADHGLYESREAIEALRSECPPLPNALIHLVERRRYEQPGSATLAIDGEQIALPPAVTIALTRVAQESVANAVRHAPGGVVALLLTYRRDEIILRIRNTAPRQRLAPVARSSGAYGLTGMRERIAQCGGSLTAGPTADGWAVTARVPR